MERKDIEKYKKIFSQIKKRGYSMFGKEAYDKHIVSILDYFGYSKDDIIIKEIFDL